CPHVKPAKAERDRNESHREHDRGARSGFENPAQNKAPRAAGQILQHENDQTAQADAEPKIKGDQVRKKELPRHRPGGVPVVNRPKGDKDNEACESGLKRQSLKALAFSPPKISMRLTHLRSSSRRTCDCSPAGKLARGTF